MIDVLALRGIEARCVVVADDDNLTLARSNGLDTFERDNRWLGRKFNDGIEYALAHDAQWVVPIGSDSWIDPIYFQALMPGNPRSGRSYAIVEADRMLVVSIEHVGPHVLPRHLFERSGPRPAKEQIRRGFDRSLLNAIGPVHWEMVDFHPLQYVGFRGERHITTYTKVRKFAGGSERFEPWRELAEYYDPDLVEQAQAAMAGIRRPLSFGRFDAWSVRDKLLTLLDKVRR
ncbi:MAG: hypothetical protein ACRDHD_00410 [Candidatus Limnocylindria bacterium]